MSRFTTPEVEDSVGCNLIPMIDIMFLLLLFFMLSADMGQRELADLQLAEADQVREEQKERGPEGVTTVNVHHKTEDEGVHCAAFLARRSCQDESHWQLSVRAKEFDAETIRVLLQQEAQLELEDPDPVTGKRLSRRKTMIRADALAPYGSVQQVLEGCALAGIYKVEIAAAKPAAP